MSSSLQKLICGILDVNLRMRAEERLLFFTDAHSRWEEDSDVMIQRRSYLHEFYEACRSYCANRSGVVHDKYTSTERHGAEPRENIWRLALGDRVYGQLVDDDLLWRLREGAGLGADDWAGVRRLIARHREDLVDAVVAFPWYSTTHTRFRRLLNEFGCRYASMPMLTDSVVAGPLRADWTEVAAKAAAVYRVLLEAESFHLTCPEGTDLVVASGGRELVHKDDGCLWERGVVGNLPAGEAYLVPMAGSAVGRVVFTTAPQRGRVGATTALVEGGRIVGFKSGTEYARVLEEKFERDLEMRHIAELGVGTNRWAKDVSSMIEGEKVEGTVHIAIGSDHAMGGKVEASEHLDHVIVNPTLIARLKGQRAIAVVKQGRLIELP